MEVVNKEADGSLYLKGEQLFQNPPHDERKVTLFARLPVHSIKGFQVSAADLTHISMSEERNGEFTDYAATGWDTTTSRRLSGFSPDIDGELKALEGTRSEIDKARKDVEERAKAVNDEKERLKKDRDRLEKSLLERQQRMAQSGGNAGAEKASAGNKNNQGPGSASPSGVTPNETKGAANPTQGGQKQ